MENHQNIRTAVRDILAREYGYGFGDRCQTDARVRSFVVKLRDEAHKVFLAALESTRGIPKESRLKKYKACIEAIPMWNESVRIDEMHRLKDRNPTIDVEYGYAVRMYVRSTFSSTPRADGSAGPITYRLPRLETVYFTFLRRAAMHDCVKSGDYFNKLSSTERDKFLTDQFLASLYELLASDVENERLFAASAIGVPASSIEPSRRDPRIGMPSIGSGLPGAPSPSDSISRVFGHQQQQQQQTMPQQQQQPQVMPQPVIADNLNPNIPIQGLTDGKLDAIRRIPATMPAAGTSDEPHIHADGSITVLLPAIQPQNSAPIINTPK